MTCSFVCLLLVWEMGVCLKTGKNEPTEKNYGERGFAMKSQDILGSEDSGRCYPLMIRGIFFYLIRPILEKQVRM